MPVPLTRSQALDLIPNLFIQDNPEDESLLDDVCLRMKQGKVIPIISSTFRLEHIFRDLLDTKELNCQTVDGQFMTIANFLSQVWARQLKYPFADCCELARVAQYNRIKSKDDLQAKARYLAFLKMILLTLAGHAKGITKSLEDQQSMIRKAEITFSEVAGELGYPQFKDQQDPLDILAKLPLIVYLTTSCHDFLEKALVKCGKQPVSQVCFWSGSVPKLDPGHRVLKTYTPTETHPLVYHLYGLENYPSSLVLSEDDYLRFLTTIKDDRDTDHPVIPLYLRSALKTSSLILLGYRLWDWDFRVLFHGLITELEKETDLVNLIIQLTPEQQYQIQDSGEARNYLETYFNPTHFQVEWNNTDLYLCKLWDRWNWWRSGE